MLTFRTPYFKVSVISAGVSNQSNQFNLSTFQPFNYLPLFIALLFVSHPIQTQAVTYIIQRFTSLATFFYLLSLVSYIKFRISVSGASRFTLYAVSLLSSVLAMKTKEIAFTLPVVIALYEFMFLEGKIRSRILYLIPLLLTMLIIPLSLIGIDKPIGDVIGELGEASQETAEITRWTYLFTQFRVIITYIRLLFLPINQNFDYDYSIYHSFLTPDVLLSFLFLLLIFGFGVYLFYVSRFTLYALRLASFGIFWFFITLSVESSVIPIRDVIFEHRLYLPSLGGIFVFASIIFWSLRVHSYNPRIPTAIYLMSVFLVISLSSAAYQRNTVWKDEISLWSDVARKSPEKARPHHNLGVVYALKGWSSEAMQEYKIALSLKSRFFSTAEIAKTHNNIGVLYSKQGQFEEAVMEYKIALELLPNFEEAHYNLAVAYLSKEDIDSARKEFEATLRINPLNSEAPKFLNYIEKRFSPH